jgi:hypothetical protein
VFSIPLSEAQYIGGWKACPQYASTMSAGHVSLSERRRLKPLPAASVYIYTMNEETEHASEHLIHGRNGMTYSPTRVKGASGHSVSQTRP